VIGDDALHLGWFSLIAKRYKPLVRLADGDREALASKILEALREIETSTDFPAWAREPLADGLRRLQLVITKLEFFGLEAAIDGLLNLYHRASEVEDRFEESPSEKKKATKSILTVLNVIALAVNLFCAPDMMNTAFKNYRGWELVQVKSSSRLARCQTLLLAGPSHKQEHYSDEDDPAAVLPKAEQEDAQRPRR
jgi:hypothetical protein